MSVIQIRCRPWSVLPPGLFRRWLSGPRCSIDGADEHVCVWGDNVVPVWPGWHHLRIWHTWTTVPTSWHMRLSVAEMRVHVADVQALHILYNTGFYSRESLGQMTVIGTSDGGLPPLGTPPAYDAAARPDSPRPRAGWYLDPAGRRAYRWWDGRDWSTHVSDAVSDAGDPHLR